MLIRPVRVYPRSVIHPVSVFRPSKAVTTPQEHIINKNLVRALLPGKNNCSFNLSGVLNWKVNPHNKHVCNDKTTHRWNHKFCTWNLNFSYRAHLISYRAPSKSHYRGSPFSCRAKIFRPVARRKKKHWVTRFQNWKRSSVPSITPRNRPFWEILDSKLNLLK